ncbi:MAG: phosphoenolpyruvate--protein phosphotransferase, partial [Candidatus Omnitrophica bacterium]|nr:phosphoenolpyruvate--protein phosphotransferase [Candidatus Omnitrophota bacterium]
MIKDKELTLKGIPAAPGIVIGKALLLDRQQYVIAKRPIKEEHIPNEIKHFKDALIQTKQEIVEIKKRISEELGTEHGQIFSAHLLV